MTHIHIFPYGTNVKPGNDLQFLREYQINHLIRLTRTTLLHCNVTVVITSSRDELLTFHYKNQNHLETNTSFRFFFKFQTSASYLMLPSDILKDYVYTIPVFIPLFIF